MQSPQTVAQNWASQMQASQQKIQDGINAVTESPTAKAAQSLDKYLASTQAAVASGKMAQRLNSVSLATWKQAALAKVSRVGTGASAAVNKMTTFMQQWLPFVSQVRQTIKQMPSTTPADRINRMVANAQALAQFKRS